MSLRHDNHALWAEFVGTIRETVGDDWTEDQIASIAGKVRSKNPDLLPRDIGRVFEWCSAATRSGDEEAIATVELWQDRRLPIEIMVGDDGSVSHRLAPEASQ